VERLGDKAIEVKKQIVLEIKEKMEKAQGMVFYDYRGLTVEQVSELRNQFREAGVEYTVLKNSMLKRAADMLDLSDLDEHFVGPTAVAFGFEDPVAPAKVLVEYIKKLKKTEIKVGVLDGKVISINEINNLAALPSRDQLLGMLAGTLNAPITGLARSLSGIISNLGYALNAVREQKEA
jgi:large subunit ribosomal protein L10